MAAALVAVGALALPQMSQAQTLGGASGPAGDATKVEKCDAPKGTLAWNAGIGPTSVVGMGQSIARKLRGSAA